MLARALFIVVYIVVGESWGTLGGPRPAAEFVEAIKQGGNCATHDCEHGARCVETEHDGFRCDCKKGYSGLKCHTGLFYVAEDVPTAYTLIPGIYGSVVVPVSGPSLPTVMELLRDGKKMGKELGVGTNSVSAVYVRFPDPSPDDDGQFILKMTNIYGFTRDFNFQVTVLKATNLSLESENNTVYTAKVGDPVSFTVRVRGRPGPRKFVFTKDSYPLSEFHSELFRTTYTPLENKAAGTGIVLVSIANVMPSYHGCYVLTMIAIDGNSLYYGFNISVISDMQAIQQLHEYHKPSPFFEVITVLGAACVVMVILGLVYKVNLHEPEKDLGLAEIEEQMRQGQRKDDTDDDDDKADEDDSDDENDDDTDDNDDDDDDDDDDNDDNDDDNENENDDENDDEESKPRISLKILKEVLQDNDDDEDFDK